MSNTKPKQILMVENKSSGQNETDLDLIKEKIQAKGWKLHYRCFEAGQKMQDCLQDLKQMDAVIGVGGDGTISGLAAELRGTEIPLLAYPGGTANLIAQNLFTQLKPEKIWEVLESWHIGAFDLGQLKTSDCEQFFIMAAGAGADATMIRDSEDFKDDWGFLAYFISLWKQLKREPVAIKLELDGKVIEEKQAIAVLVANLSRVNFRLPISHQIHPQDGLLDVIVVRELTTGMMAQTLWHSLQEYWQEKAVERPEFGLYQAKKVKLSSDSPLPIQQDGEYLETHTPVSFERCPQQVHLFYEASAQPDGISQ